MNYVIGSGPAGIACAQALLQQGAEVTLLDVGNALEAERTEQLRSLVQLAPTQWDAQATSFLGKDLAASSSGIPLKLAYGSDYPYRAPNGATPVTYEGVDTKPAYSQGGFSTVWGSAVLPYREEDMGAWPTPARSLASSYRAVLQWMPLAGRRDNLEPLFPLHSDRYSPLPISAQASALLRDLERNQAALAQRNVHFGTSRLAVQAAPTQTVPGCVACGLCMYGCPYGLIYSSAMTLARLTSHPKFHYKGGIAVRTVDESGDSVSIRGVNAAGEAQHYQAERVFIAAGVIETAAILLRSAGWYGRSLDLLDSQYFLLPLLRLKGTSNVATERLHTLAQLFLEILDPQLSPHTIHLQTYTYNELFRTPVLAALGPARPLFPLNAFLGRLLLFQGYLHSDHSARIRLTLQTENGADKLHLQGLPSPETKPVLRKLIRKLIKISRFTGLLPLIPMLQAGKPGRGFHCGGTFPMRENPDGAETDIYGRPFGLKRIHAVDASVFPSVPATTITFTAMANAHRIGSRLPEYA